ncbi:MAG: SGNH/GDSL hydrolase family protein [Sedimenticola sp.]
MIYFNSDVWILGDSIPYWAGERARDRHQANLRIPEIAIGWYGVRGMRLRQLIHSIQLKVVFQTVPRLVVVHMGGNDILLETNFRMFNAIRSILRYIRAACPESVIVWVDILQRRQWTTAQEGKRRRVNRYARQQVDRLPKGTHLTMDIDLSTPGFYRPDGIHLSDVGLEFYLDTLRDKIIFNI